VGEECGVGAMNTEVVGANASNGKCEIFESSF